MEPLHYEEVPKYKMRIEREDLVRKTYANWDCTHFVLRNLAIPIKPGRVPGEKLDKLLKRLETTTEQHEPTLIVYNIRPHSRHFGFAKKGRVVSKWGLGPVYEHHIDDVPLNYKTHGYIQYSLPENQRRRINKLFTKPRNPYVQT